MSSNYTQVNAILTESQFDKLKHSLRNDEGVTLRLNNNVMGNGSYELYS